MSSNTLNQLQQSIQAYLLQTNEQAVQHIRPAAQQAAVERLQIYSKGYLLRLAECLAQDYPVLRQWLGEEAFDQLVANYLAAYPSQHFSIRYVGQVLAQFLTEQQPYAAQPELAEFAQFEWAIGLATDAADANVLTQDDLMAVAPEQWANLQLALHPSIQTLKLHYNISAIWQTVSEQQEVPKLHYQEQPTIWLIWRNDLTAYYRSINEAEQAFLTGIQQNENFATLCELLCDYYPEAEVGQQASYLLQQLINDKLLIQCQ